MLYLPAVVITEPIGEFDLIERLVEQIEFARLGPRSW
jgi:hypothetical protein